MTVVLSMGEGQSHEVVVHEVEGQSVFVVLQLFENPLVSLVNRLMLIRMVRFCRST